MTDNTNPFEFFNLKITVFINEAELNDRYQAILENLHPDNFVNDEKFMQTSAEKLSAFANEAYQILKDPFKRCLAALNAKEWPIDETVTDNDFLMEMMELQEMAEKDYNLKPFFDDALYKLENALQNNDKHKALEAYNRLSFLKRYQK
jgi:molecular chaperone HscB